MSEQQFSQKSKVNRLVQSLTVAWFLLLWVFCCSWVLTPTVCGSPGVHAVLHGNAGSGGSWADRGIWAAPCSLGLLRVPGQPKSSGSSAARDPPQQLPSNLQPGILLALRWKDKTVRQRFGSSGWAARILEECFLSKLQSTFSKRFLHS